MTKTREESLKEWLEFFESRGYSPDEAQKMAQARVRELFGSEGEEGRVEKCR